MKFLTRFVKLAVREDFPSSVHLPVDIVTLFTNLPEKCARRETA
ncbi:hypothetical protein [Novosphingobium lentum]|nr:hypothetical protein [Novosphingobium lentum]